MSEDKSTKYLASDIPLSESTPEHPPSYTEANNQPSQSPPPSQPSASLSKSPQLSQPPQSPLSPHPQPYAVPTTQTDNGNASAYSAYTTYPPQAYPPQPYPPQPYPQQGYPQQPYPQSYPQPYGAQPYPYPSQPYPPPEGQPGYAYSIPAHPASGGVNVAPYPPVSQNQQVHVVTGPAVEHHHHHHNGLACGVGIAWILFIIGWFTLVAWIAGSFFVCIGDKRERKGGIANLIALIIAVIIIVISIVS